ncbi:MULTISPECIES: CoA ester lyase [unclassified Caballeronia]|uniref:HpcH/HpaI aldolase/citrate lyase family protein n=1 Tax=unclassified Caballeronia TaxID=2646786 RepID=UPI0028674AAA|nr:MULTISPECIES: CoA ester lyase [unclassified Caballeronia]MDR5752625.1 CoA ester lyase [Caballeronia sp. LZ024]MDR5841616.1 CoA ester lyase [Caballeronia sp. LZ031]
MTFLPDNDFTLLRSWLFVPGADLSSLLDAPSTGADVIVQELEDFTPAERRPQARTLAAEAYNVWRSQGIMTAVRVNPFETCGLDDLRSVMAARPAFVMMSKVEQAEQVVELDRAITQLERELNLKVGSTQIVPNIESARGIVNSIAVANSSERIKAMLVGTEDMVVDLGADRSREGTELLYPRSRFLLECAAAGVVPIDCPYTFSDAEGAQADMRVSRSIGYKAKAVVNPGLVELTNHALTPSSKEVAIARSQIGAFEAARVNGDTRAKVGGLVIEYPSYFAAKRLLERHEKLRRLPLAPRG